jgi:hypothetical protein
MDTVKAGFFMGLFSLGLGTIGVIFGVPLFLGYLISGAGILFFLSGFAFSQN